MTKTRVICLIMLLAFPFFRVSAGNHAGRSERETGNQSMERVMKEMHRVHQRPGGNGAVMTQVPETVTITGTVVDENGGALPGVTVLVKGTTLGTSTDLDGKFSLQVPVVAGQQALLFTFIGMKTKEVLLKKEQTTYKVTMEEEAQKLEDVVVTGYFQRKKVSQTGSEVVVDGEELRKVGSLNLLQAISSFDPGVRTLENNEWGSDPNRMPEITVRGEKGFDLRDQADDSRTNPNAPLAENCIRFLPRPTAIKDQYSLRESKVDMKKVICVLSVFGMICRTRNWDIWERWGGWQATLSCSTK